MYSLIMMAALTPGADVTPAPVAVAPVVYGCTGCYGGCTGITVSYGSCYGCSGCFGCTGCYGCSGCYGSCHGKHHHGIFGHRKHSCHGCSGYSCSGYNCFGSCHGCGGYTGCYGGCVGYAGGASSWGPPIGMPPYTLHGYNQGGTWTAGPPVVYSNPTAVYGSVTNVNPPAPTGTGTPADPKPIDPKPMVDPKPAEPKMMGASIKFQLPAGAKLIVDGRATTLTGAERSFSTPPLAAGQKFFYDVKAELMVDGTPVVEEKRVIVEAGANVTETFPKLFAAVERSGNPVAGK